MSDQQQGHGWWQAADGKWYPPSGSTQPPPAPPTPPFGPPPPLGPKSRATAAFTLGIISLALNICYVPGILAIVWGNQERRSNRQAQNGFILGIIGTALSALLTVVLIGVAAATPTPSEVRTTAATLPITSTSTRPTTSPPTTQRTLPPTTHPASVSTSPLPTSAPTPSVLLERSGSGSHSTEIFTAPKNWDLAWSYDCTGFGATGNFQVFIEPTDGSFPSGLVNQLGSNGTSVDHFHSGGELYLMANSECDWSIKAIG